MSNEIDWLNDNSGAVQAASAAVLVLATTVLVVVTGLYAKFTHTISTATASQVKASRDIAEATMRPVISLWIKPVVHADGRWIACYQNIGNGPAVNLAFECPDLVATSQRVGMSVSDPVGDDIVFDLAKSDSEKAIAVEYDDAAGWRWRTELLLVPSSSGYDNGATTVTKVGKKE